MFVLEVDDDLHKGFDFRVQSIIDHHLKSVVRPNERDFYCSNRRNNHRSCYTAQLVPVHTKNCYNYYFPSFSFVFLVDGRGLVHS